MSCWCVVCCGQYFDYVVRVLMPEVLVKIVMQIYNVTQDEAEQMLAAEPPDNYDDDWSVYSIHCVWSVYTATACGLYTLRVVYIHGVWSTVHYVWSVYNA